MDSVRADFVARAPKWLEVKQLGWKVWQRGLEAFANGHGVGMLAGDGFQMPGVFLLHRGQVLREFRHESAADRPDYLALAQS